MIARRSNHEVLPPCASGLFFATVATLVFVPVVFSIVHRKYGQNASPTGAVGDLHHAV